MRLLLLVSFFALLALTQATVKLDNITEEAIKKFNYTGPQDPKSLSIWINTDRDVSIFMYTKTFEQFPVMKTLVAATLASLGAKGPFDTVEQIADASLKVYAEEQFISPKV